MRWGLVALSVLVLVMGAFLYAGSLLVADDDLESADLCHVLSGNDARFSFAVKLYERGLCAKLAFIGGKEGEDISFASRRRDASIDRGVAAADIMIDETDVFSTFEEITRLMVVIEGSAPPVSSVMHVTDPFHTRRVRMVSGWILGDSIDVRIASVPSESTLFQRPWWEHRRSRKMVFREYSKLIFYWLRYRIPFQPLNDWLSGFDKIND